MSWGEIFFGFHGRINRKTYWLASILVAIAGLLFNALLSYLATGDPIASEVWERAAEKSSIWTPVWLAYFAFLAWPSTALAVKRLHDRDRPAWIWYLYYSASLVLSLIPLKATAGGEMSESAQEFLIPLVILGAYIFFELGVLRGTVGPNQHGEDTLPAGYYGGDYSFWSWMFAFEGRISRAKWWLGFLILTCVIIAVSIAVSIMMSAFISQHPELQQKMTNPEWLNSKEAAPLMLKIGLWTIIPSLIFMFALWSMVALGVKRLHDRGLSSWLILVVILPLVGVFASPTLAVKFDLGESAIRLALLLLLASVIWSILQFGILKGETGPNKHGPDPLAG
jgi:uncharacterized membrane protein YhaH (DUF805 family)